MIRLLLDWLETRSWASAYLKRQKRSESHAYASMGRFRESSTLTVDSDERWDRYEKEYQQAKAASRYLRENCCFHFQSLQEPCPYHPPKRCEHGTDISGPIKKAACNECILDSLIDPRKECL